MRSELPDPTRSHRLTDAAAGPFLQSAVVAAAVACGDGRRQRCRSISARHTGARRSSRCRSSSPPFLGAWFSYRRLLLPSARRARPDDRRDRHRRASSAGPTQPRGRSASTSRPARCRCSAASCCSSLAPRGPQLPLGSWRDYVTLTKPRIMILLLLTGAAGMFVGANGVPDVVDLLVAMLGLALACGGASALNHVMDADIDQLMGERTAARPVASGRVAPARALEFGLALSGASFALLAVEHQRRHRAARARGQPLLRARLHRLAQARDRLEHRHRRRRGRRPAARRFAAATGDLTLSVALALPHRLPLDAAPLLGAGADDQGPLRGREGADAPGHARRPRDDPPDPPLHASSWSPSQSPSASGSGVIYTGVSARARARVLRPRLAAAAARDAAERDGALPLLARVPRADLHRSSARSRHPLAPIFQQARAVHPAGPARPLPGRRPAITLVERSGLAGARGHSLTRSGDVQRRMRCRRDGGHAHLPPLPWHSAVVASPRCSPPAPSRRTRSTPARPTGVRGFCPPTEAPRRRSRGRPPSRGSRCAGHSATSSSSRRAQSFNEAAVIWSNVRYGVAADKACTPADAARARRRRTRTAKPPAAAIPRRGLGRRCAALVHRQAVRALRAGAGDHPVRA